MGFRAHLDRRDSLYGDHAARKNPMKNDSLISALTWPSKPLRIITTAWLTFALSISGGGFPPLT